MAIFVTSQESIFILKIGREGISSIVTSILVIQGSNLAASS